jgi:hypothetical protein
MSPRFRSLARNEKSVTIDIREEEGRACVFEFHYPALFSTLQKRILSQTRTASCGALGRYN